MVTEVETFQFQAETRQLLDLMIHSLYSNKQIFLRELISNASDALDRLRFEALTTPELMAGEEKLEIRLEADEKARTLTIRDNGIGMSREEVIANIGTIAKSGTRELMERVKQNPSETSIADLIGQFGVGFYSSFMVADKVSLVTRRAGEEKATFWESMGDGSYTIAESERAGRGTTITLHLKPEDSENGLEDFTDQWIISRTVRRYSDFVGYPIILKTEREEPERDAEGKEKKDGAQTIVVEDKTLNSMKPLWLRPASEVTDEEYAEFYKHISHDWTEPLKVLHFRAEGRSEYQSLLFIPATAPYDLYYVASKAGLQLYVRKVLIMDSAEDLIPHYLRFIKGVVDSSDLPLNISRETLQQDRHITQIRRWLTRKILDALAEMQEKEADKYKTFWESFGRAIKEGIGSDFDNKERILPLLLFQSSADPEKLTTFKGYVERMKEGQKQIFYLTGESREVVQSSPHLEAVRERGYEVLFLVDTVDELMIQSLTEFEGKKLKSLGKGTIELGDEEEKKKAEEELKEKEKSHSPLLERMQKELDFFIKHVRLSNRLTTSPVCLVGADHDYSPQLERLLQKGKGGGPKQRYILEVNPDHPILARMQTRFDADKDDPKIADYSHLLLGYALLAEGSELPEPAKFTRLVADLMVETLGQGDGAAPAQAVTTAPESTVTTAPESTATAAPEATAATAPEPTEAAAAASAPTADEPAAAPEEAAEPEKVAT